MKKYDWIPRELFDRVLGEEAHKRGVDYVMSIDGVYELVAEDLNNVVLNRIDFEKGDEALREALIDAAQQHVSEDVVEMFLADFYELADNLRGA